MASNICLCLLVVLITVIQVCHGSGKLSFRLLKFNNQGGKDDNGNCCDFWCFSDCDYTFTICLDNHDGPDNEVSTCNYGKKTVQDNAFTDKNSIDFTSMSFVGDHSNPMMFTFAAWPGRIKIKVNVYDVDDDSNNDFVDYLQSVFVDNSPARSVSTANTRHLELKHRVSFTVDIKVYCDANYYGNDCATYCVPKDDDTGHYTCSSTTGAKQCLSGWTGLSCSDNINDCTDSSCHNGGVCIDKHRSYRCNCLAGFTGTRCQTNIDECGGHLCANGASCNGAIVGYTCDCTPGWTGEYCEDDIDECANNPCLNNGTCEHGLTEFTCTCKPGWTGEQCEQDILECNTSPCENDGTCEEILGTFKCWCSHGWSGDLCNQDIDDCSPNPCQNNGTCFDKITGYVCTCSDGWEGTNCTDDINECASSPCLNGGTCLDLHNSFNCTCAAGWEWDRCEHNIDDCQGVNCNHGTCLDYHNNYECQCNYGYTGLYCADNIDDCLMVVCGNNGTCEDRIGEHYCYCAEGWTGVYCEINVNECDNVTCQHGGLCIDGIVTFVCNCSDGFDGDFCENDINECAHSPCLNGGSCSEFIGYYTCACAEGWSGKNCKTGINECENNPCLNFGVCDDLVADYRCTCTVGWTGTNCDERIHPNVTRDCTLDVDIAMDRKPPVDSNGNRVSTYDPTQKTWPATVQIGTKESRNAIKCAQSLLKSWFHQSNKNKTTWFYFGLLTESQDNPNDFSVVLADACGRIIFGEVVAIPRKFSFEYRAARMAFRVRKNGGQWSCDTGGSGLNRWVDVVLSYQPDVGPNLYIDGVDCELQMESPEGGIPETGNPYEQLITPCEINICGDPLTFQSKYTGYMSTFQEKSGGECLVEIP